MASPATKPLLQHPHQLKLLRTQPAPSLLPSPARAHSVASPLPLPRSLADADNAGPVCSPPLLGARGLAKPDALAPPSPTQTPLDRRNQLVGGASPLPLAAPVTVRAANGPAAGPAPLCYPLAVVRLLEAHARHSAESDRCDAADPADELHRYDDVDVPADDDDRLGLGAEGFHEMFHKKVVAPSYLSSWSLLSTTST